MTEKIVRIISWSITLFVVFIFLAFFMPHPREIDFYAYHVWECEECHKRNGTFHLCSGFCTESESPMIYEKEGWVGIDVGCAIPPNMDCKNNIPHGSLTGQMELHFGLLT